MKKSILTIAITMISTLSMLSQSSWMSVGTPTLNGTVTDMYSFNNKIYATVSNSVSVYTGSTWTNIPGYTGGIGNSIIAFDNIANGTEDVIVCSNTGVWKYSASAWSSIRTGTFTSANFDNTNNYLYLTEKLSTGYKMWKYDLDYITNTSVNIFYFQGATAVVSDVEIFSNKLYVVGYTTTGGTTTGAISAVSLDTYSSTIITPTTYSVKVSPTVNYTSAKACHGYIYISSKFGTVNHLIGLNSSNVLSSSIPMVSSSISKIIADTINDKITLIDQSSNMLIWPILTSTINTETVVPTNCFTTVNCLLVFNNELYAGGSFISTTNNTNKYIAKYNSTSIPTGITEFAKTNSTLVYPNPSNGIVNVITEENSNVLVLNNLGQIVLQFTANSKVSNINIQNAGIYTVQISKNNQVSNSRLIIQ